MKKIAFFGGSVPAGGGFPDLHDEPGIYPNIIKKYGFDIENCGFVGGNNAEIFLKVLNYIIDNHADIIVIEWNYLYRFRFWPNPNASFFLSPVSCFQPKSSIHYQPLNDKDIKTLLRLLIQLNHEYVLIKTLLDYCRIITSVCKDKNIKLVMLNGAIPWKEDMFQNQTPGELQLSEYTRDVINLDDRDENDVIELLNEIQEKFQQLDPEVWATNPFMTINELLIDFAPLDDGHPGPQTHQLIADFIYENIKKRHFI